MQQRVGVVKSSWLVVAGLLACATGCDPSLAGSGKIKDESRSVSSFHAINVSNGIHVVASVGPVQSVDVRTDDNLLNDLKTSVDATGVLRIGWDPPLVSPHEQTVTIETASLDALSQSGGSQAEVTKLETNSFSWDASGGSQATLSGETDTLNITASGGAQLTAHDLVANQVSIQGSGGSEMEVQATQQLTVDLSGGSQVKVVKRPSQVTQSLSGGSEVDFEQ
jgi:hypothetical protein